MDTWTRIIGLLLALYAAYSIYRGRVIAGDEGSSTYIERARHPVRFWISVAFMLVAAGLLMFNVFHF
jgi:hypothetical protein